MKVSELFAHWSQIRTDLVTTIEKFEDDELSYKPTNTDWSVGTIMLHIAEAEEGWFQYVVTRSLKEWPVIELESYPDKAAIKAVLAEVHGRTERYLSTLMLPELDRDIVTPWGGRPIKLEWIIWHVLEHEIHHRGELSLILGLLGKEGLDV